MVDPEMAHSHSLTLLLVVVYLPQISHAANDLIAVFGPSSKEVFALLTKVEGEAMEMQQMVNRAAGGETLHESHLLPLISHPPHLLPCSGRTTRRACARS